MITTNGRGGNFDIRLFWLAVPHVKYLPFEDTHKFVHHLAYQGTAHNMPISLSNIVADLPSDETWGPPTSKDTLVDGVPYAPYSKGDKLGRCADWTIEGKDQKGERRHYNRQFRGEPTISFHGTSLLN